MTADARSLLETMIFIRRFEERCEELYRETKIRGFMHVYIGEEAIAVGVMDALEDRDAVVATYREHGHAIARGVPPEQVMAEMFGKVEGCSRGRGGSMHLFCAGRRFFGGNAIVAGGLPLAVGLGLADKMRGTGAVTVCFFGEGAAAEGEFHEALNLAALWNIPVLFVCENNLYAMGTALARSESEIEIHKKAASYKIPAERIDGMDVLAVQEAARRAVDAIRADGGPRFLECETYRFRAHSMFDPQLYRERGEVETWKERGPIRRFRARAKDEGWLSEEDLAAIESDVKARVDQAVAFAEAGHLEPVEDLTRDVYTPRGGA